MTKSLKIFVVVSAPSGAGKTSLIKKYLHIKTYQSVFQRLQESQGKGKWMGVDYIFVKNSDFESKIKNEQYIEYAQVHSNYYGTVLDSVVKLLEKNIIVILEIDYQGAETVKKQFSIKKYICFTPSLDVLEKRLRERGTDEEGVILERLKNARIELSKAKNYDYILENDDSELAEKKLLTLCAYVGMI